MRIELTKNRNQIVIEKPYSEMVRFRRLHGLFAEFDIKIEPRKDNLFQIETDDEVAKEYINYSINGLKDYFNKLSQKEIMLIGISASIKNNKFHAVDSKPICYQIALIETLNNLINLSSTRKLVSEPTLKGKNYLITKYEDKLNLSNIDYDCCYLPKIPITQNKSIEIIGSHKLQIMDSKIQIIIESKSKYFDSTTSRQIGLWFKKKQFMSAFQIRIYEIIQRIISDFKHEGLNLFGFIIYFDRLQEKEEWQDGLLVNFEWSIRNLLTNKNSIELTNEARR